MPNVNSFRRTQNLTKNKNNIIWCLKNIFAVGVFNELQLRVYKKYIKNINELITNGEVIVIEEK